MYYQIVIVIHVLLGLGIIGLVLMQQGKGADAGAAFGSGSSGSVFGAQGAATFLSKTTAIFATLFFATSLGLAWMGGYQYKKQDIMDDPVLQEVDDGKADVPSVDFGQDGDGVPVLEQGGEEAQDVVDEIVDTINDAVEQEETDTDLPTPQPLDRDQ